MNDTLKLALEALEELYNTNNYWWQEVDEQTLAKIDPAITAIKAALAQPTQEPEIYSRWQETIAGIPVIFESKSDANRFMEYHFANAGKPMEQPAQEPTGMLHIDRLDKWLDASLKKRKAQRTWVDLTEDEMDKVRQSMFYNEFMSAGEYAKLVQIATQTKLKEKNNG